MKRSDMINAIAVKVGQTSKFSLMIIEDVIEAAEKMGMLPPKYFAQPPYEDRGKDHLGNYVNQWEPEDE